MDQSPQPPITPVLVAGRAIARTSLSAVITRADGTVEDLGEIASTDYTALNKPWYRKLGKFFKTILPFVLIAATAAAGGGVGGLGMATLVVNTGRAIITNRIRAGGTEPNFVAWGTGAGTAAAADTTLFTEASEARVSGTSSQQTTSTTNDTYQVIGTMTVAGSGKTITNAGLFDASTSGNLFFKADFTGLPLLVGDSIAFTFKVQFS